MSGNSQLPRPQSPYGRPDSTSGPSTNSQEYSDSQRSLQQASVALEVAFDRIRQVRRSLMELSESLPSANNVPRFSMNYSDVRPGHEALLLAGDRSETEGESSRVIASTPFDLSSTPPRASLSDLEQPSSIREIGGAQGANEAFLNRLDPDSILFEPLLPNVLPPRFSRRELSNEIQYLQRRGINYDPASTLRGIRVAAREAHGRTVQELQMETQSVEYDRLLREADVDGMRPTVGGNFRPERQNRLGRNVESRDARRVAPSPPLPAAPPAWRAPDPRRWRMRPDIRANHRPLSDDAPDRFHTVTTMLNTPYSTDMPRNVPRLPLSAESRAMATPSSAFEQYRFYQDAAARSEDMASNVNIDWSDDDFISWLFPAQDHHILPLREPQLADTQPNPETIRITRTTDTAVSPPEGTPPRRGWARLDADGNEIPANEEEELERSRTVYRLQALQRSRQNAATQVANNIDNPLAGGMLQNYGGQRNIHGSVLDSTLGIQDITLHNRRSLSSDFSPLYVDPLPMPLTSMISTPEEKLIEDAHGDIVIPKNACLAGR